MQYPCQLGTLIKDWFWNRNILGQFNQKRDDHCWRLSWRFTNRKWQTPRYESTWYNRPIRKQYIIIWRDNCFGGNVLIFKMELAADTIICGIHDCWYHVHQKGQKDGGGVISPSFAPLFSCKPSPFSHPHPSHRVLTAFKAWLHSCANNMGFYFHFSMTF